MISILNEAIPVMEPSAASVRILSLYESYGCNFDFLRFYTQKVNDVCTAVISVMDNHATVHEVKSADYDELLQFLCAIGCETVFSESTMPLKSIESGTVMHYSSVGAKSKICEEVNLTAVYNIMSTCFAMPDFNIWYPDISHRIRHGGATAVLNNNGCAVALTSSKGALISGICVDKYKRNKGNGTYILQSLLSSINAKDIFALIEENGPINFYKKNGFSPIGKFNTYKVK